MVQLIKKLTWSKKAIHFWAVFFVVFFVTVSLLYTFNLLPRGLMEDLNAFFGGGDSSPSSSTIGLKNRIGIEQTNRALENPLRIIIGKIGVDQNISNPESTDISVLDESLLKGVVRYPGSGVLGEESNMFLFGHSTGLKNVKNQAFKAFNDLGKLQINDEIIVAGEKNAYIYRVVSSKMVNADTAWVELSVGEAKLTLSTCNTFGEKQDRFVVEAVLEGKYEI